VEQIAQVLRQLAELLRFHRRSLYARHTMCQ
jgi:hypothetical protein